MPHRAYHLVLGLAGLLAVAVLLLAGADLLRQSRSGPGWKRRLVSAGLLLLGALGFGSLGGTVGCPGKDGAGGDKTGTTSTTGGAMIKPPPGNPDKPDKPDKPAAPAAADPFKELKALQTEAELIASGKQGQYPFDRAGQQRLLTALQRAPSLVDDLQAKGELSAGEAGLWKQDLVTLTGKVAEFRPTEMKNATCYQAHAIQPPGVVSLARLRLRLPLLEQLVAADRLRPEVTRKILTQIEADLRVAGLPAGGEDKELVAKVQELVVRIKGRLDMAGASSAVKEHGAAGTGGGTDDKSSLDATEQWRAVKEAWRAIAPLAAASSRSTSAQRSVAEEKLKLALTALDALVQAGKLSAPEAGLLRADAERLRRDMVQSPPTDFQGTCYRRAPFIPAAASLAQLNKRLPLLQQLAARKAIQPAVVARMLPTLERDVQILSSDSEVQRMGPAQRAKVPGAVRRARELIAALQALAGPEQGPVK